MRDRDTSSGPVKIALQEATCQKYQVTLLAVKNKARFSLVKLSFNEHNKELIFGDIASTLKP